MGTPSRVVRAVVAEKLRGRVKVSLVLPAGHATVDCPGVYWRDVLLPALRAGYAVRGVPVIAETRADRRAHAEAGR